jgi:AcrR family transcriptional regulator
LKLPEEFVLPSSRRDQILDSALVLFRAQGLANVSTRDLAEQAGIARSHIYHYFADWNELRLEAFVRFADEQLQKAAPSDDHAEPLSAVRAFLRDCLPAKGDDGLAVWLDAWDEALHDPKLAAAYLEANRKMQCILATLINRGVAAGTFRCQSPERVARQLFALAMGYANDLMLLQSTEASLAVWEELDEVSGYLLGLRPELG